MSFGKTPLLSAILEGLAVYWRRTTFSEGLPIHFTDTDRGSIGRQWEQLGGIELQRGKHQCNNPICFEGSTTFTTIVPLVLAVKTQVEDQLSASRSGQFGRGPGSGATFSLTLDLAALVGGNEQAQRFFPQLHQLAHVGFNTLEAGNALVQGAGLGGSAVVLRQRPGPGATASLPITTSGLGCFLSRTRFRAARRRRRRSSGSRGGSTRRRGKYCRPVAVTVLPQRPSDWVCRRRPVSNSGNSMARLLPAAPSGKITVSLSRHRHVQPGSA